MQTGISQPDRKLSLANSRLGLDREDLDQPVVVLDQVAQAW